MYFSSILVWKICNKKLLIYLRNIRNIHKTTGYKFVFEAWIDEPQHITVQYSYEIPGRVIEDEKVFVIIKEDTLYIFYLLLEETYTKIIYELVAGE